MLKNCVVCGAEFDAKGKDKSCSAACRRQRRLTTHRAWYRTRPPEYSAKRREHRHERYNDPIRNMIEIEKRRRYRELHREYIRHDQKLRRGRARLTRLLGMFQ